MVPINLSDVKIALKDERFIESLPKAFSEDIQKYKRNPGCGCNVGLYKKILVDAKEQLKNYFPGREISDLSKEVNSLAQNNFSVINCKIEELENILKKLPPGRKQIAITRFQNDVTVVLNELELIY